MILAISSAYVGDRRISVETVGGLLFASAQWSVSVSQTTCCFRCCFLGLIIILFHWKRLPWMKNALPSHRIERKKERKKWNERRKEPSVTQWLCGYEMLLLLLFFLGIGNSAWKRVGCPPWPPQQPTTTWSTSCCLCHGKQHQQQSSQLFCL